MARSAESSSSSPSTATTGVVAKLWLTKGRLRNNMDAAKYKNVVLSLTLRRNFHSQAVRIPPAPAGQPTLNTTFQPN